MFLRNTCLLTPMKYHFTTNITLEIRGNGGNIAILISPSRHGFKKKYFIKLGIEPNMNRKSVLTTNGFLFKPELELYQK